MKRLFAYVACLVLFTAHSFADSYSGGGGGGGGPTSITFNATCPASTQTGSTITLTNGVNAVGKSSSYQLLQSDCGTTFDVSGSGNTQTMPTLAAGYVVAFKNTNAAGGSSVTISAGPGQTIDGNATFTLLPLQYVQLSASTTGTNFDAAGLAATSLPCNVGYVSGRWFPTCGGATGGTGSNMGAGNVSCSPYNVSSGGGTFKAIGGNADTTDTSGTTGFVSFAIYTNSSGLPGTLIDSVGTTAVTAPATAGSVSGALANVTDVLSQGFDWLCAASPSTTFVLRALVGASTSLLGGSTAGIAVNGSNSGVSGYQCTAGSANCGPTWTSTSSYTWPSTLVGATWTQRTNGGAPALSLQAN